MGARLRVVASGSGRAWASHLWSSVLALRSVKIIAQRTSRVVFAVLKVRRHTVSPSAVSAHPAMAFWAAHETSLVETQCLLKRYRLPHTPRFKFAVRSAFHICSVQHVPAVFQRETTPQLEPTHYAAESAKKSGAVSADPA